MSGSPLASERFARHALDMRFEDLTDDAIGQAKVFILDTLGVGISGSTGGWRGWLARCRRVWGVGDEAIIWGRRGRVPAPAAALLNGFQIHCQEYDCVHEGAVLHPMATLLPALLATADRKGGVSGRDLMAAVAVGCDISAGLGIASRSAMRFFRPATAGGFGATAGVARLMGFDLEKTCNAFGLQYAQTSGTLQPHVEGSVALPLQVGLNSAPRCRPATSPHTGCRVRATCSKVPTATFACSRANGSSNRSSTNSARPGASPSSATSPTPRAVPPTPAWRP